MSTIRGSANSDLYEVLLPFEPSEEPPPVRPTIIIENDPQPSFRKRASRALFRFLIVFCIGVAATLTWQSYGDAARQMIANSYPDLGWLAPLPRPSAQNAAGVIDLAAPTGPSSDQQQLNAMSIDAMRQEVERIAAGHEQLMRGIDQIAARIRDGHEQMTRGTDETATTTMAADLKQIASSTDETAHTITGRHEQMTLGADPASQKQMRGDDAASPIVQAPSAKTGGIMADGASVPPTTHMSIKQNETSPPQTLPESGKQVFAASGHDPSCLPSAAAVWEHHQGAWASWTLRAAGHEGTMCWYASTRPRARDYRYWAPSAGQGGFEEVTQPRGARLCPASQSRRLMPRLRAWLRRGDCWS
ncbi:MAG: hypothetical protein J2P54_21265 [Bradyrhizobiaceae bacterium]|nr:hypothetical protein [Bradyrhizobiaceae bacterium]